MNELFETLATMEHARKRVLVPLENVEQLRTRLPSVQTPGTTLSRLDAEMNHILNSTTHQDDREKWNVLVYEQVLQRYLRTFNKVICEPQNEVEDTVKKQAEKKSKRRRNSLIPIITDSVSIRYQRAANLLLRHLTALPTNRANWDQQGFISIDDHRIPEINIIDLVYDAMRRRKQTPATGRRYFAHFL